MSMSHLLISVGLKNTAGMHLQVADHAGVTVQRSLQNAWPIGPIPAMQDYTHDTFLIHQHVTKRFYKERIEKGSFMFFPKQSMSKHVQTPVAPAELAIPRRHRSVRMEGPRPFHPSASCLVTISCITQSPKCPKCPKCPNQNHSKPEDK